MKKYPFLSTVLLLLLLAPLPLKAKSETRPAETQPETRPIKSTSMIDEALTLVEIYGKVRRIIGKDDRSGLKVQLDELNGALDQILYFKNSFTPKKMQRIEKQMAQVKGDVAELMGQD